MEPHHLETTVRPDRVYEFWQFSFLGSRLYTFDFPSARIPSIPWLRLPLHLSLKSVETISGCALNACRRRDSREISLNMRQPGASPTWTSRRKHRESRQQLFILIGGTVAGNKIADFISADNFSTKWYKRSKRWIDLIFGVKRNSIESR